MNFTKKLKFLVTGNLLNGCFVLLPRVYSRIHRELSWEISVPSFDLGSNMFPCHFFPFFIVVYQL